jgi:hypothetical protein
MNPEEIRAKFKKVSDEVESNASQMEQDVKNKVAAIQEETAKKFTGVISG